MAVDSFRFRCTNCRQLLGASFRRIGTTIACPRCGAELKVPAPEEEEQTARADASRTAQTSAAETPKASVSSAPRPRGASKSAAPAPEPKPPLPSFMEEIAAAIPDDLAALRPEDIRVEAEFADLVINTSENITLSTPTSEPQPELRQDKPVDMKAYLAQSTSSPQSLPLSEAEVATSGSGESRAIPEAPSYVDVSVERQLEPAAGDVVLPPINVEAQARLRPGQQIQPLSEVVLQPATVLAWSLLVLLAIPMAFLAGLMIGHFVWK